MVLAMTAGARRPPSQMERARDHAAAHHEGLVAYVHALSHPHEARTGVWMEHSYARARGSAPPAAGDTRVLLAPRAPRADSQLDVERVDPPPPDPPADYQPEPACDSDDDDSDALLDDWEERVAALAPSAECATLAARAAEVLRAQRLATLATGGAARRDAARVACRRLRAALASLWAGGARAPAWLHTTLCSHLPRQFRRLYEEALSELRRCAPRLAERLGAGCGAVARGSPEPAGAVVESEAGPWLVWVEAGGARGRWARWLRRLVHTRALPLEPGACGVRATPAAWCAGATGAARAALADILAEAGERGVVVGGAGAGAAVAAALAAGAGARVRGLVLVAAALAEGAGGAAEVLGEVRAPVLVAGGGAARAACARGGAGRRGLAVRGADAALRVSASLRSRLRLPQHALDAAVAEECARWTLEVCEGGAGGGAADVGGAGAPAARRSPAATAHTTDSKYYYARAAARADTDTPPDDDPPPAAPHTTSRAIEIVEGRVVSRVSGGTPLALLPPRRAPLAAADIMQMPIVFADDEHGSRDGLLADSGAEAAGGAGGAGGALTVRGGRAPPALRYARVIVAKRGGAGVGAGRAGGGAGGGLLLRRAARRERR